MILKSINNNIIKFYKDHVEILLSKEVRKEISDFVDKIKSDIKTYGVDTIMDRNGNISYEISDDKTIIRLYENNRLIYTSIDDEEFMVAYDDKGNEHHIKIVEE